ncbi:MAG TPA: hypothetical protein VFR37_15200, partial [Longimicrobium sp.]|nr:hypothetical protein [Longimicrobium sp.]
PTRRSGLDAVRGSHQPNGSTQVPVPARIRVLVVIVVSPPCSARQPSGSTQLPPPARTCVVVLIARSFRQPLGSAP